MSEREEYTPDLLTDTPSNDADADADADVVTTGHGRWRPATIVADLAQEIAEASAEISRQLDEIFRDMYEIVQALSAVAEQQRVGNLTADPEMRFLPNGTAVHVVDCGEGSE